MTLEEYLSSFRGKTVAVLGYGVSNRPLVRLLAEAGLDATVRDKGSLPEIPGVRCISGEGYLEELTEDVIFRTPGLRPDRIPRKPGAVVTSEMEAFFALCPCPILAVTGSDGKTTTTTLIAELLKASGRRVWLGGNIGHPLLAEVPEMDPEDRAVLELSSFQLMDLEGRAEVAVVTNVRPNHLDWHTDLEEYAEAKKHVFRGQKPGDLLVLNGDDPGSRACAGEAAGRVRFFSRREAQPEGAYFDGERVWFRGEAVLERKDILLPGLHNVENWMAALCAVCDEVGPEVCRRTASAFSGVAHRLETVRRKDGVEFINDSIASSPSRTAAGLLALEGRSLVLIAGGYDKHIPYDELGRLIAGRVKALVLCGATAEKIRAAVLAAPGPKPVMVEKTDFREAVLAAAELAEPGDTVLLSPASASFDLFKNFEERGDRFREIVRSL
ncbi:MAG: UDP-N-acetylmuramoyl-L-alanine--D-glutamate ligase [Oscillospiraceae bacterium]|nr:UDP-N-acetylmuramoyl-L-alanine--D-glutamate ligase [Oscillospiraceae bacterium]MBR4693058.1 UDP-N-acetylmuramoyl-L-alanine--D-glutamate ligase [Oscillospiraceae bacterium]